MIALLARHGETTWNLAGRYQGRKESSLSALGVRQGFALAEAMAQFHPRIERIISSPLLRCVATARFTAGRLDLPVQTDERLIEIGHGVWEGRLRDEIAAADPDGWYLWKNDPTKITFSDGDSIERVAERWRSFIADAITVPTLIVSHDATARVAVLEAQGRSLDHLWDVQMENAAYAQFDAQPGAWKLTVPLVNAHLTGLQADVASQAL